MPLAPNDARGTAAADFSTDDHNEQNGGEAGASAGQLDHPHTVNKY